MTEHLSQPVIELYRERSLPPAELIAADDHLGECEACRGRLEGKAAWRAAAASLGEDLRAALAVEPEHLRYEQLAAYVDREADAVEREIIESHLSHCRECVEQFEELRAFAAQLSTYPEKQYAPAAPPTLLERLRKFLGLESLSLPSLALGLASAAALLLVALPTVVVWRVTKSPTKIAVNAPAASSPTPQPTVEPTASPDSGGTVPRDDNSGAPALAALSDGGGQIALGADGRLVGAESLSAADRQRVVSALKSKSVSVPASLSELGGAQSALMGSGAERTFALVSPVAKVVASDRPLLRWQPLAGAESYRVEITDPEANYREVATSPALSATEWRVNHSLERGRVYTWQVVALKGGEEVKAPSPDAPEAKFKVLERAKLNELERAKKNYAGQRLILGLLYAQAGLLDEAERELRALVAANPNSAEAKGLLRSVRAKKRGK
jgi:predicted anti-sigma-YlaC factor YlaD